MTHLVGTAIRRRLRSERGSFSAMIIGLIVMLLMVAGLVIDGGLALNARAQTYDDLEQAARLGANEIDAGALRSSGQVVLIPGQAEAKATAFLHQLPRDYPYTVIQADAGANSITVYAERDVGTALLNMIGIDSIPVSGEATATAEVGID